MKNGCARIQCKCSHEFQDKTYGRGVRVANATAKQEQTYIVVRCTVCNSLHQISPDKVK